jgi:hypothetical protein
MAWSHGTALSLVCALPPLQAAERNSTRSSSGNLVRWAHIVLKASRNHPARLNMLVAIKKRNEEE